MSTNPPPGPGGFGRSFEEIVQRIESELRQAIAYVNDAVVPEVRRESISAVRGAAEMLGKLADRLDAAGRPPKPPAAGEPGGAEPGRHEPGRQEHEKDPRV